MNAKQEFLRATQNSKIICAKLSYSPDWSTETLFSLKTGYTQDEYNQFVDALDFDYDSGYGLQHLYGTIWCEDGVWFTRHEYDGAECWEVNKYPDIPSMDEFGPISQTILDSDYGDDVDDSAVSE